MTGLGLVRERRSQTEGTSVVSGGGGLMSPPNWIRKQDAPTL